MQTTRANGAPIDIDAMVETVVRLLERKTEEDQLDVYAWSDGTVTTSWEPPAEGDRIVSLFSPSDSPYERAAIRTSIERGFETVPPTSPETEGHDTVQRA